MPTTEAVKTKISATHRRVAIQADAEGNLPDRIELVRTGQWPEDSNKGYFEITHADLLEMKYNFDQGVSMPEGLGKLAVDFMHEDWDKAAIWIGALEVDGDSLFGTSLEYTTAGREAILGGEFKCISPSFYPRSRGQWHDPEDWSITAEDVIVGAALTNIPFFKKLKPITASNSQEGEETTLFVDADAKGANMPTLEDVRVKAAADLNEEEKTLLAENKDKLTADEKVKFGFETATATPPVNADTRTDEQKQADALQASINAGTHVVVKANDYQAMQAQVTASAEQLTKIREEKVAASVDKAIESGKIVADQKETWVKLIMANADMEQTLNAIPENKVVTDQSGRDGGNTSSAVKQLRDKANEIVKASRDAGNELSAGDAMSQARRENPELREAADLEMKEAN